MIEKSLENRENPAATSDSYMRLLCSKCHKFRGYDELEGVEILNQVSEGECADCGQPASLKLQLDAK